MMFVNSIKIIYNTLYFNFKAFPLMKAIKIPAICGPNVYWGKIERGKIISTNGIHFNMMSLGRTEGSFMAGHKQRTYIAIQGKGALLKIKDRMDIPCGSVLNLFGCVEVGTRFMPNSGLLISCENKIIIGDNCNIGWNVTIIDGDGHPLCNIDDPNTQINDSKPVTIGKNCWIAAHASIMKGVHLADHTIIPYGSIITKSCKQPNVIYGGSPNIILKENVARQDLYNRKKYD